MTSLRRKVRPTLVAAVLAAAVTATGPASAHAPGQPTMRHWVAAWGASPTGSASGGPTAATVRNVVRVTLSGNRVRIRLTNALSATTPLVVGAASVGISPGDKSNALVLGTSRRITFGGRPGVTLRPGTPFLYSDPVALPVHAQQDLAVSLYLPAAAEPGAITATWNTSYATANGAGNRITDESGSSFTRPANTSIGANPAPGAAQVPLQCAGCGTYALTAVDVDTTEAAGAYIGLASSTFHGYNSTQDGWNTVLNDLSRRVDTSLPSGQRMGIVSAGIGADTLHAGMTRLDRDVLSQSGVRGVILYDINDTSVTAQRTAKQIEADYLTVIAKSHRRGVKVLCPTWAPESLDLTPSSTTQRHALNDWLLHSGACDDTVDWDKVLRDTQVPDTYNPAYTTDSDTIHPNPAGHKAMSDAVPLRWFTVPRRHR